MAKRRRPPADPTHPTAPDCPLRTAVYLRVSTQEQAAEGVSLDAQLASCTREAQRLGDTRPAVYRDDGYSGTSADRPGLKDLLDNLGDYDSLVVWRLDRLSRSVFDWARILRRMLECNVGFSSVTERVDVSTAWGRAMLYVMAVFAELFVEILRENVRAALQYIASEGRKHGAPAYGYRAENREWVVVPEEAAVIRRLYRDYDRGASLMELARGLTAQGVVGKRGGTTWTAAGVREILTQPAYAERMRWHGETIPSVVPRIVAEALWLRVQERVASRTETRGRRVKHFATLFRCGVCGSACMTHHDIAGPRVYRRLRCRTQALNHAHHEPFSLREDVAMRLLWDRAQELLAGGESMAEAVAMARSREQAQSGRRAEVQRRLRQVRDSLVRAMRFASRLGADEETLFAANAPLVAEQAALEAELGELAHRPEVDEWARFLAMDMEQMVGMMRGDSAEKQIAFLRGFYQPVLILPGELVVRYVADLLPEERIAVPVGQRLG